ncbi:hypothetical protein [Pontibacter oryzae]|nr:hypothetical protein [Pontibacter oryzae]
MKRFLYLSILYFCLALVAAGCSKSAPAPVCHAAEVIGQDCETGWYILKLEKNSGGAESKGRYIGQLQGGYVTTDNLPEAYQKIGTKIALRLELNGAYGPTCMSASMMYLAVRVVDTCNGEAPDKN